MIDNGFGNRKMVPAIETESPGGVPGVSSQFRSLVHGRDRTLSKLWIVLSMIESLIESNYCAGNNHHIIATDSSL